MRISLFTLLFLLHRSLLPAQSPSYVHYGVSEGLPSNKVYCAIQDYRGFIWFGTDKGLARFDGKRFQIFGVKEGLPDPEVLSLFEDSQRRLWISCFSQRPCYMQDGKLITAKNDSLLAKINMESSLWGYSEDAQQRVWIAGKAKYVYAFDGHTIQKEEFPKSIVRIEVIENQQFGLATAFIVQKDISLIYDVHAPSTQFVSIAVSGTKILYAFVGKLVLFEWVNQQIIKRDSFHCTQGRVYADNKGRFWHCPNSKGAICFDNARHNLSNPVYYLPEEQINIVLEDKDGTLWFCTSGHGVYALSPGKAATYSKKNGLETNNITALARNQFGQVLAGDDGGNLYTFSGETVQKTVLGPPNEYNRCRQIICLPGDSCWVANDKDLFFKNARGYHKFDFIRATSGFKTILARQQLLWYGNHNSLGFISGVTLQSRLVVGRRTTTLGLDSDQNIWVGRLDGLFSLRDSFQYNWGDRFPALKSKIVALQDGCAGKLWVVSLDSGLLLCTVRQGEITGLQTVNQHLQRPIENIQSLFVEPAPSGRIWMATNSGVYGLNPGDWNVVHFDQHDGLADDDANCVLVALDTLWVGTVAGLSCLPLSLQSSANDFRTFITGMHYQAAGRSVMLDLLDSLLTAHQVILPPSAAMVTLNLAGLNYRSQGNLVYQCITTEMLPPIFWWTRHNLFNWIKTGFHYPPDTTVINDNNLNLGISIPSGQYLIQVTAITVQGIYSQKPDHWTIIMQPYWYNTVWLDLLVWIAIGYSLWRVLRARTVYRKLNIAVSELQLQALQSQINPHFVGNSINAIQQFFYPPNPGAASNYIELFTRLLRRTILLSEQHFNPFEAELAYDHDYLQMIKMRFGERFQYTIKGADTIPANLPFPSMLLQPLLENATIHGLAPEGTSCLILQFSYRNKRLQCTITDNGMGYKAARARPSTKPVEQKSKGLELLHKKVIAFNQLYAISLRLELTDLSEAKLPGQGTRVFIAFNPEMIKKNQLPA